MNNPHAINMNASVYCPESFSTPRYKRNKTVLYRCFSEPDISLSKVNFQSRTAKPQRTNICYFPPLERRDKAAIDRLVISIWQRQLTKREDDAVLTVYTNSFIRPAMMNMAEFSTIFGQRIDGNKYIHQESLHHEPDDKEGIPFKRMLHYHLKLNPPEDQSVKKFLLDVFKKHSRLDKADLNNIRFIFNLLEVNDSLRTSTYELPDGGYAMINCKGEQNFEDIIPSSTRKED